MKELKDPAFSAYLEALRNGALLNPDHIFRLVMWMNNNTLAMLAADWVATLPPDIASQPPVCVAAAEMYAKILDWSKLRRMVEKASWREVDYMRRAFLARSLERLGEPDKGAAEWKEAVSAARSSPDAHVRLDQLARMAQAWGWEGRWEEVLWELSNSSQCPRWVLDALWGIVFKAGETAKMQKVASLIAKADPGGVTSRNNYVFLSLLLRTEEGDPHRAAKAIFEENPANPDVATTYALSLHQQGKTGEAIAVMSALKPEDLHSPRAAFYHGVFLITAGRADDAEFQYRTVHVDGPNVGVRHISTFPTAHSICSRSVPNWTSICSNGTSRSNRVKDTEDNEDT